MTSIKFRNSEHNLIFSEEQSRTWIEHSPICTKIVDLNYNLQFMSKAGVDALGMDDVTEYYGKPYPFDFYPKAFRDEMSKNLKKAAETGKIVEQEAPVVDLEGNEVWFHSTISPVRENGKDIDYLMVVSIETTEQNKNRQALQALNDKLELKVQSRTKELEVANNELLRISETDYLTQINNRLVFNRRLKENVASAKRQQTNLALLMIDIDDFKTYNDTYGHDIGDIVLKNVAQTISETLSRTTDLVARYGGEEFVVLLPDTDDKEAYNIAEKIRHNIMKNEASPEHSSIIDQLTVSTGVASMPAENITTEVLIKHADTALYQAKSAGKNRSHVYKE